MVFSLYRILVIWIFIVCRSTSLTPHMAKYTCCCHLWRHFCNIHRMGSVFHWLVYWVDLPPVKLFPVSVCLYCNHSVICSPSRNTWSSNNVASSKNKSTETISLWTSFSSNYSGFWAGLSWSTWCCSFTGLVPQLAKANLSKCTWAVIEYMSVWNCKN